ncbi:MAG TPA: MlaD family protein, partial [Acetobacteraceae bacterium]|nr:MlaD family protein [Acetobacteraceae bacterium]
MRGFLMLKYHGIKLARAGFLGVTLVVLVIAVGLQPQQLLQWATTQRYSALFAEAGGLASGNDVTMRGIKVGSVSHVSLRNDSVLVKFSVDGKYRLGSETTAHIRTGTLLGNRVLTLESAGATTLHPNGVIGLSHTSSPYSLTDA